MAKVHLLISMKIYDTILYLIKLHNHNQKEIYTYELNKTQNKEIMKKEHLQNFMLLFGRTNYFRNYNHEICY